MIAAGGNFSACGCLLIIHHLRYFHDCASTRRCSGCTGLSGCSDCPSMHGCWDYAD